MPGDPKTFHSQFSNVDGGPCPKCRENGLLLSDRGEYGVTRNLRHKIPGGFERECTLPMSAGRVMVDPLEGVWSFQPRDDGREGSS